MIKDIRIIHKLADDEFEKEYGMRFNQFKKVIDDIIIKYREKIIKDCEVKTK